VEEVLDKPAWLRPESAAEALGARLLRDVDRSPPPPLALGRLDPEGHTILYGQGDVGKGVRASYWIAQLTRQGERVLVADFEGHPTEWARRVAGHGGDLDRVMIVEPYGEAWAAKRGPLWVVAPSLAALADGFGADRLVVDSITAAAAGTKDPYSPDAPTAYGQGLQMIGRPALSLAHISKSDDLKHPFGSIHWHTQARTTWSLHEADGRKVLTHRKRGNRPHLGAFLVREQFDDDKGVIRSSEAPMGEALNEQENTDMAAWLDAIPREGATRDELRTIWGLSDTQTRNRIRGLRRLDVLHEEAIDKRGTKRYLDGRPTVTMRGGRQ
jgi:hypothetical protein